MSEKKDKNEVMKEQIGFIENMREKTAEEKLFSSEKRLSLSAILNKPNTTHAEELEEVWAWYILNGGSEGKPTFLDKLKVCFNILFR